MFADDEEEGAEEELAIIRERYDLLAEEYTKLVSLQDDKDRQEELLENLRSLYWQLDPDDRERLDAKYPLV